MSPLSFFCVATALYHTWQVVSRDFKKLGYVFQWSKVTASDYLLLQRRNRVYGIADLDFGQSSTEFSSNMAATLKSMGGTLRFNFDDVFDRTLPAVELDGQAADNVQESLERNALKNGSSNLFVDTSTSSKWDTEYAEAMTTCIRPTHPIYSTELNRYITVAEMFQAQGLFVNDFEHPAAVESLIQHRPKEAQDLCGNAFASTSVQAQLIAGLVNGVGWKHVAASGECDSTPAKSSGSGNSGACDSNSGACDSNSCSGSWQGNISRANSWTETPPLKRKSSLIVSYMESSKRSSKFPAAPAAEPFQAREGPKSTALSCTAQCHVD